MWTLYPALLYMAARVATVDPLPFVPATWTVGGKFSSGFPSRSNSFLSRVSDRSINFGWSSRSRSNILSIAIDYYSPVQELDLTSFFIRRHNNVESVLGSSCLLTTKSTIP